ncbi:hypothetical protein [Tenacibaculum sp.]|uniref:hypothetical protein n=1 Tax=Tenacibaculum sp. TaxID=1906242 RepID=UPI003D0B54B3
MATLTVKPSNTLGIKIQRVKKAYLAKKEIIGSEKTGETHSYTFKGTNNTSTKARKEKTATIIYEKIKSSLQKTKQQTTVKDIVEVLGKDSYTKGDCIEIPLILPKIKFIRLDDAILGEEVHMVVETENMANREVKMNLKQAEGDCLQAKGSPIVLQKEGKKIILVKTCVGRYAEQQKNNISNSKDFENYAIEAITLLPKNEEKQKKYKEALNKTPDKKTKLFMVIDAEPKDQNWFEVKYEEIVENRPNLWYYGEEKWFELKKGCDCGEEFQSKIKCTRYKYKTDDEGVKHYWYGPYYKGSKSIETFSHWDTMIANKELTSNEKTIMIYMSPNEGNFDSVQSYDSVALTAGAMQKTINNKGNGELPRQIWEFKQEEPELFQKYLGSCCKWTVEKTDTKAGKFWGENENYTMYYEKPDKTKITGKELKKFIRKEFNKDNYGKSNIASTAILPIIKLMLDEKYLQKQIKDFKFRLDYSLSTKVSNYKISEYFKSNFGRALVLDQHVNAPAWVQSDFQSSLNRFFNKKDKEIDDFNKKERDENKHKAKISRNPNDWGNDHSTYENEIIKDYGTTRRGTDMKNRYNKIKNKAGK